MRRRALDAGAQPAHSTHRLAEIRQGYSDHQRDPGHRAVAVSTSGRYLPGRERSRDAADRAAASSAHSGTSAVAPISTLVRGSSSLSTTTTDMARKWRPQMSIDLLDLFTVTVLSGGRDPSCRRSGSGQVQWQH